MCAFSRVPQAQPHGPELPTLRVLLAAQCLHVGHSGGSFPGHPSVTPLLRLQEVGGTVSRAGGHPEVGRALQAAPILPVCGVWVALGPCCLGHRVHNQAWGRQQGASYSPQTLPLRERLLPPCLLLWVSLWGPWWHFSCSGRSTRNLPGRTSSEGVAALGEDSVRAKACCECQGTRAEITACLGCH